MPRRLSTAPRLRTAGRLAGAAALAMLLAACADRVVQTGSIYPADHRDRHPITLSDKPVSLDIFVRGAALDGRQRDDVKTFAADYRANGRGGIAVQTPSTEPGASHTLAAIRAALDEAGIPRRALAVSNYTPADTTLAAPIRLSFRKMQAGVAGRCGLWPQDLGVGDAGFNARNEPYWNLGCATQNNFAAQISDPVDLVRGRTPGAIDPIRRTANIEKLREGVDPSTQYRQDGQNAINQAVAQ
ncbi:MAG: pilus assembly protein CpaD [Salinarimonadaceae bacterium]|nr:MAG: pilus assembly protein CpaD [Salinarimonadaceae bacterium]